MTELPETRQSLLVQLQRAGQEDAWNSFLNIYEPAIYRFALSRGLQEADANDVTQQVLLAVHDRIETWDPDNAKGNFRGWLFRVTRNLASKQLRQARRHETSLSEHELDGISSDSEEDQSVFLLEYRRQVFQWATVKLKDEFKPSSWLAFWKTSIGTDSAAEVANELGLTVGAVYAAKCRVMSKLREIVNQLTDFEIPEMGPNDENK